LPGPRGGASRQVGIAVATQASRAGYSALLMPISDLTLRGVSGACQRLSAQAVDGAVIILEARFLDRAEFVLPPGIAPPEVLRGDWTSDSG
jgi:hypothetical protein